MKSSFRAGLSALLFFTLSLTLYARGTGEASSEVTGAVLKGPSAVGAVHLLKDAPEGVSFEVVPSVDVVKARILVGSLDFAVVPVNLAAVLYNKGVPYRLAAVTGNGVFHLVSTREDVASLEDLRGKQVHHIARGATPDVVFRYLLSSGGLDPETDLILDYSYNQLQFLPQLLSDRLETGVLPEPFVSIARAKKPSLKRVLDLQELWTAQTGLPLPATALIVKKDLPLENPKGYEAALSAYEASIAKTDTDPDLTASLAQEILGFPRPVIRRALPDLNLTFKPAIEAREALDTLYGVFYGYDPRFVGGKVPDDGFYGL